ncbi:MAG: hypothetical protein CVV56_01360 [Tenericutes bacterium HGW-Tenericutes-1]|jgi:hypothetical protein|nr:MAG: hypothetical protein CVV56_01360 [Tenericutes bacterium HGW-Tenericutes-1]
MNAKWLKIIAVILMIIDHIGFYLIPEGTLNLVFRAIGRIAYPLFAFMIAEGFHKTHHLKKYFLRLLLAALIMELIIFIIYLITSENYLIHINVFIPLLFGLLGLTLFNQPKWYLKLLIIPLLIIAEVLQISYGLYGVLIILIFGIIPKRKDQFTSFILMSLFFIDWPLLVLLNLASLARYPYLQWASLLSFIPIMLYNGEKGSYNKWIFYAIYPLHLGIILLIKYFITR